MQPIRASFKELNIGAVFTDNGNDYIKKTSRTAYLIKHNKVFYFKANEIVSFAGQYSSLYDGRYTVKQEHSGSASPTYITRFCGDYVGSCNSKEAGEKLADWHLNDRLGTN